MEGKKVLGLSWENVSYNLGINGGESRRGGGGNVLTLVYVNDP